MSGAYRKATRQIDFNHRRRAELGRSSRSPEIPVLPSGVGVWALIAFGVAEILLAFYSRSRRRIAFIVLSTIASALLLAAIPFRFSGSNWSVLWLLEMETLLFCGLRMRETVFRRLGILAGYAAATQLAISSVAPIYMAPGPFGSATAAVALTLRAAPSCIG